MFQLKFIFNSAKNVAEKAKGSLQRAFTLFMIGFMGGVQAFA